MQVLRRIETTGLATAERDESKSIRPELGEVPIRKEREAPLHKKDRPTRAEGLSEQEREVAMDGILTAEELVALDFPKLPWVIRGMLPAEGVTILAGKPKVGESVLLLNLAVAVAGGRIDLEGMNVEHHGDVLFLGLEDSLRRLQRRLQAMLDDASAPPRLQIATKWPRLDEGGLTHLENWVKAHRGSGAPLIVIDTLALIRPIAGSKGFSHGRDYETMESLTWLSGRYEAPVIASHHERKSGGKDPLDVVTGTTGLTGAVDTVAILGRGGKLGTTTAQLFVVGRDVEEKRLALEFDKATARWRIVGRAEHFSRSLARQKVIELLRREKTPQTPKAIAQQLGKKDGAMRKLLAAMYDEGELVKVDRGKYTVAEGPY